MTMAFICEIMGIPREDWPNMFKWGNMVAGNEDPEYQVDSGSALDTRQEGSRSIGRYCMDASLDRRGGSAGYLPRGFGNAIRELSDRRPPRSWLPPISLPPI